MKTKNVKDSYKHSSKKSLQSREKLRETTLGVLYENSIYAAVE
jgi:hypothetical protein